MDAFRTRAGTYPPDPPRSGEKFPKSKTFVDLDVETIKRDISEETSLDLVQEVLTLLNITKLFTVFSRQLVKKYDASNPGAKRAVVVRACTSLPDPAFAPRKPIETSPLGNCTKCLRTVPFEIECEHCAAKQLYYCTEDLCWMETYKTQEGTYVEKYPQTSSQPWMVCVLCRTLILTNKFIDIHQLPRYRVMRGVLGKSIPVFEMIQEKARVALTGKYWNTCDLQDSCIEQDYRLTKLTPSDCPNCMRPRRVIFYCRHCNVLYSSKRLRADYIVYSDYKCPRHYYEEKYGKSVDPVQESSVMTESEEMDDMNERVDHMVLAEPPRKRKIARRPSGEPGPAVPHENITDDDRTQQ